MAETSYSCPICCMTTETTFTAQYVIAAKCSSNVCGHIFAVDTPPGRGVQQLSEPEIAAALFAERDKDLAAFFVSRDFIQQNTRLLDVGAGNGHILRAIRVRFPNITIACVEADGFSKEYLQAQGYEVFSRIEDVTGTYDAILLVELIEHVEDPVAFMTRVAGVLAKSGSIFLTTPCGELPSGRRPDAAYSTKEHVHFFTEKSLLLCLEKAGFNAFRCETIVPMLSKLTKPPLRYLKDALRPIRSKLVGRAHLTGFGDKNVAAYTK